MHRGIGSLSSRSAVEAAVTRRLVLFISNQVFAQVFRHRVGFASCLLIKIYHFDSPDRCGRPSLTQNRKSELRPRWPGGQLSHSSGPGLESPPGSNQRGRACADSGRTGPLRCIKLPWPSGTPPRPSWPEIPARARCCELAASPLATGQQNPASRTIRLLSAR